MTFSRKIFFVLQPWKWPSYLLWKICKPVPWGLASVNFVFQRILRINGEHPFQINFTSRVVGDVEIGRNVWISFAVSGGCYIQGNNGVKIGDDTIFAPGVKIISANHDPYDKSNWIKAPSVVIGSGVWIGANAVILPAVRIGDGSIIGAGAIVTQSIPAHSTAVGNPAKVIKSKNCT